jgi:hypothetical protein
VKIRKHTLASLLLISVLVISIFTLFFAASISYKQIKSLNESGKAVLQSYKVNLELEKLNSYVKDAESSQRGYLLTKDSTFLQSYHQALEQANLTLDHLRLIASDNFQQLKSLETVKYLIEKRFDYLARVLESDVSNVSTSDTTKRMLVKGRDLMGQFEDQVDKMIAQELELLRIRQMDHDKYIKFSPFSVLFVVLLALCVFIVAYSKINKDLKSLTKTNNQLLINKEIFEHSEQIANISNWCWNKDDNKLTYSNNLYHLLGCTPGEVEATGNFIEFVHPDDRQFVFESSQGASDELVGSVIFYRVIRKDGAMRRFKSSWKVITDNFGKTFIIGVNADITEQYNKDQMIGDKIAALEKSNKELSAFNHIASHDLQEPLRKVQTFVSRIREKNFESFPENVKDYFSGIERATKRMQMFIEDLLLYSRASNVEKVFELTDLNTILDNAKQELSQRIEEKNVKIQSINYLPTLKVIPFQIQQLFNNLLSNSIKYSKPNIVPVISINTRMISSKALPVSAGNPKGRYYKISIADNGIGFNPEHAEDIFKLFYRLHNKSEYSGTGVGLAICKVIVENHNGYIKAESSPNVGTTISIYLPV